VILLANKRYYNKYFMKGNKMKNNIPAIVVALFLSTGLIACSEETTQEQLSKANKWLDEGNNQAAILVLKKAAQADSANSEIRYKLGIAYLQTGMPASAEKELKFALERGYESNLTIPLIAKSLLLQFKNKELTELVNNTKGLSLEAMTTLYTLQAQAYFTLGDNEAAKTAVFNANEISAESPYSRLGLAYGAFNEKEISLALDTVNQILEKNPEFTEALLLKGQMDSSNGDYNTALKSFEKYHNLLPDLIQGRVYLADSYIKNNMLDKAEKHVDYLLQISANSPFINQLKSQIKYQQNDYVSAKKYAETAINYGGENQVTNTIAAVSAYQLGLNEQAFEHLSNSIDSLPKTHQLRGLYEILKLKLGYSAKESFDKEVLLGLSQNHQSLLIQSALTLSKEGKLEQAQSFLDVIDSSTIDEAIELTRLSMLKIALNDKTAFIDLEKVISNSPGDIDAHSILASVYSAEGEIDKALMSADAIIKQYPMLVDGYNLKGSILANNEQFDEAKLQYQLSLEINPKDIEANLFFGKLALRDKDEAEALIVFRRLINFDPIHLPSLITYFALEHKVGNPEDAIKPIQIAYNANPTNTKYALFYAKLLETNKQYDDAISILNKITISKKLAEPYWNLLVEIYSRQGKSKEIESTLLKWTSANPESGLAWRYLTNLYENKGEFAKALDQAQRGLSQAKSDRDNLVVLEAQHLIFLGRTTEAKRSLDNLTQLYGAQNPVVGLLKSQFLMLEKNFKQALPLLTKNYEYKPSTKVLKLILDCYVKLNDRLTAVQFTQAHLEKFTGDNTARLYLAGLVMNEDKPFAESIYREILKTEPLNQIALNNLAAVLQQQDRGEEAIEITKDAVQKAPNEPYVLEIYASALLKHDKPSEALTVYAKAYSESDKSLTYAKFYVDALRKTGNDAIANKISRDAGIK
jgi:putative PEP-CTERM system TPR-repeat lipoprotein